MENLEFCFRFNEQAYKLSSLSNCSTTFHFSSYALYIIHLGMQSKIARGVREFYNYKAGTLEELLAFCIFYRFLCTFEIYDIKWW